MKGTDGECDAGAAFAPSASAAEPFHRQRPNCESAPILSPVLWRRLFTLRVPSRKCALAPVALLVCLSVCLSVCLAVSVAPDSGCVSDTIRTSCTGGRYWICAVQKTLLSLLLMHNSRLVYTIAVDAAAVCHFIAATTFASKRQIN